MSDLVEQIDALLALNAKGAVSHPIPGLAVELLERSRAALTAAFASLPSQGEQPRPLVDELTGALRFILAFYEPGQTYLDTNAWKVAEAGGRNALAKGEAYLAEQATLSASPSPYGVEELVERLREEANKPYDARPHSDIARKATLLLEAVTVIQTLQRENARLEGEAEAWAAQLHHAEYDRDFNEKARANWKSRAEAAEQQVRDMREGLEPFARVGDIFELRAGNRPNSDDDPVTEWEDHRVGARRLTVGDFRRARLLLKEGGE